MALATALFSLAVVGISLRRAADELDDRQIPLAGLAAAFIVRSRLDRQVVGVDMRYIDPEVDNKTASDKGFFSRFKFWGGSTDKSKAEQYRVLVKDEGERAEVNVLNKEGAAERSATANRILTLLYDQLK